MRVPSDLEPHMPEVLWLFQMGVIFFWITDDSPEQKRAARLLELSVKVVVALLKLSDCRSYAYCKKSRQA